MKTKQSELKCYDVARAALGEPMKAPGGRPEVNEAWFICNQHADDHPSLKVNVLKNTWMDGPCNASGNAWELAGFLQGKGCQWESYNKADQQEITDWLKAHGLLAKKETRSRSRRAIAYPVLREFIYRDLDTGAAIAKRIRYDTEEKQNRFGWLHSEKMPGGVGWKPGFANVNMLPLYIGIPAPKDEATFVRCLAKFRESKEVFLTEGEHDADAGAEIGFPTASGGGVTSIEVLCRNLECFKDKDVSILAHADAAGLRFAEEAAALLHDTADSVRILKLAECWPTRIKDLGEIVEGQSVGGYSIETINHALRQAYDRAPVWKLATGAEALDAAYNYIRRFTKISEAQARACTLWVAAAFIYQRWDFVSYLQIYSAERGEGKSTLVNVLAALLGGLNVFIRPTLAALFTDLDENPGATQCIDEIDKMFCGKREFDNTILAYLTAGFQRGRKVPRVQLGRGTRRNEQFETFCPKILAGRYKETLDGPTQDRCLQIRMEKCLWDDHVKRWVFKFHLAEGQEIGNKLRLWCQSVGENAVELDITGTKAVDQRVIDIWEPLLALAELAGPEWLTLAKLSMVELHAGPRGEHDSREGKSSKHIYTVRQSHSAESRGIHSNDVATALHQLNEEYREFGKTQKPITSTAIARILAPYEIRPDFITIEGRQERGYLWVQFESAWEKYTERIHTLRSEQMCTDNRLSDEGIRHTLHGYTDRFTPCAIAQVENNANWFRLSELRAMRRGIPQISILTPNGVQTTPRVGREIPGPGRLTVGHARETAALSPARLETRIRAPGFRGIERRGK